MSVIKTIMVIDDNPYIVDFLIRIFSKEGFKVISKYDGKEALELLLYSNKNFKLDLIITDDKMPIIDGLEFANTLREFKVYESVPIILYTQFLNSSSKSKKYKVFDSILHKPNIKGLISEVQKLCSKT